MKIKHIIGGVLIMLGMLSAFGAVGHLDYLDKCGEHYGVKEVRNVAIRSVAGLAAVGIGAVLCYDIEVDDKDRLPKEKENRADK